MAFRRRGYRPRRRGGFRRGFKRRGFGGRRRSRGLGIRAGIRM